MKRIITASSFILASTAAVFSQAGSVDLNFNPGDFGYFSGKGPDYHVSCSALQSDGKILIGGDFYSYNQHESPNLARVHANGLPDVDFAAGLVEGTVNAIAVQRPTKFNWTAKDAF